ncbi:MAG TPA: ribosome maturation factor RimM [Burkholderiaceae bacterium]|nr:ribosome maturation factor RimM [Burkholderiaceae bacterium]
MLQALEPTELPEDAVEVGRIADAWGLKGWFKVLPHSADPEALFSSKRWYLQPTTHGKSVFVGTQLMRIREAKFHSDSVVAAAHDIDDRDRAQSLKGSRIFIPRSSFPTPELDSYYWVDLIGLDVVNRESIHMGVVKDLLSTGPQTVLVIEYTSLDETGQNTVNERMIPFVSHYVDDVNLQNKRITVDWQTDY